MFCSPSHGFSVGRLFPCKHNRRLQTVRLSASRKHSGPLYAIVWLGGRPPCRPSEMVKLPFSAADDICKIVLGKIVARRPLPLGLVWFPPEADCLQTQNWQLAKAMELAENQGTSLKETVRALNCCLGSDYNKRKNWVLTCTQSCLVLNWIIGKFWPRITCALLRHSFCLSVCPLRLAQKVHHTLQEPM